MMICLFIVGALIQGKSSCLLCLKILNIIMAYLLILCFMSFLQSSLSNSLCILLPILLYSSLLSLHLFLSISLYLSLFPFLPLSLLHLLLHRCQALMSLKSIRPIVSLSLSCYSLSTFPTPTALLHGSTQQRSSQYTFVHKVRTNVDVYCMLLDICSLMLGSFGWSHLRCFL